MAELSWKKMHVEFGYHHHRQRESVSCISDMIYNSELQQTLGSSVHMLGDV